MAEHLRLHEAIVACMVRERKFTMGTAELAMLNARLDLFRRPKDGKHPEAWQVFLRANQRGYRWLFKVTGNRQAAKVSLRRIGDASVTNL